MKDSEKLRKQTENFPFLTACSQKNLLKLRDKSRLTPSPPILVMCYVEPHRQVLVGLSLGDHLVPPILGDLEQLQLLELPGAPGVGGGLLLLQLEQPGLAPPGLAAPPGPTAALRRPHLRRRDTILELGPKILFFLFFLQAVFRFDCF